MKICWLTDIHLNFLSLEQRVDFYKTVLEQDCEAIAITGDIADAPVLVDVLQEMARHLKIPIYFVLGNHDFYHSEIVKVKQAVSQLCANEPLLIWLNEAKVKWLTNDTLLIGQDGWSDGRYGDYQSSNVVLNDSRLIYDLFTQKILGKNKLLQKMQQLADADATALEINLEEATKLSAKKIIILTHVAPFVGACWHEGEISDENWLPFFASKATGDVIYNFAEKNPNIEFMVLCGHSHSEGIYQPLCNLLVKTGKAKYYHPEIQEIIVV